MAAAKLRHVARLRDAFFSAEEEAEELGNHRNVSLGVDEPHTVRIAGELRIGPDKNDRDSCLGEPCQMLRIVDRAQDDIDPEVTEHPQRCVNIPGDKSAEAMSTEHGPK